jgi:hypothetical protein
MTTTRSPHLLGMPGAAAVPSGPHRGFGAHDRVAPAGVWGLVLAVLYAVLVRFYQASGGTIGLAGSVPRYPDRLQAASYAAGVLILLGGLACLLLSAPFLRRFPGWLPLVGGRSVPAAVTTVLCAAPALAGGLYAIVHGIAGWTTKLLGLVEIHYPVEAWARIDVTGMDVWSLLFYEPWFLAMDTCLVLSLGAFARASGARPSTLRRTGTLCGVIVGLGAVAMTAAILADARWVVG